jgi:hypothetical protein
MYGRLLMMLVAVTLGLIATVFFFNWLWIRAFGPGVAFQGPTGVQRTVDRKALRAEHAAREAAKREKAKYSPEILTEAARVTPRRVLSASEYDPKTGRVEWPALLLASEYETPRGELEHCLQDRANGAFDERRAANAQAAAARMQSILRENIKNVPTDDYIAARSFLESLTQSIQP